MSQLGFLQMSSNMKFDKNPNDGKDSDGFDEEVLIMDDSPEDKSGIRQATLEDPLKSQHIYIDKAPAALPATVAQTSNSPKQAKKKVLKKPTPAKK